MLSIFCVLLCFYTESGGAIVAKNFDENEIPGPPSKPQVTDVTKNSVSLSWQPGMTGASPVSSYVIEAFRSVYHHTKSLPCSSIGWLWMLPTCVNVAYHETKRMQHWQTVSKHNSLLLQSISEQQLANSSRSCQNHPVYRQRSSSQHHLPVHGSSSQHPGPEWSQPNVWSCQNTRYPTWLLIMLKLWWLLL